MAAFTDGRTLLLFLVLVAVVSCTASVASHDYEPMQRVLRSHGYNLICNSMDTSDLQYELLTLPPNASFTIFTPTDASLIALDMIQTASSYIDKLRLHVVPLRLSLADLRSIHSGSILPTLLPSRALTLSTNPLAVSGVDVVVPGLYYSRCVAVHGLGGIVSLSSVVSYASHNLRATAPGAGKVSPSKTVSNSNRTNHSAAATPPSEAVSPPVANRSASADHHLSPPGAEPPVVATGPPSPTGSHKNSTASDENPPQSPPSADSVPDRARALLMETTDEDSDSDGDGISEKAEALMDGKVKKCGSLDEMTIDCIVADTGMAWKSQGLSIWPELWHKTLRSIHRVNFNSW